MAVTWDAEKELKLRKERGIEISEVADLIASGKYLNILENPSRPEQLIFVLTYKGYTHVVPFVIDNEETIVLKTVFPSRRFHQLYGASDESKT